MSRSRSAIGAVIVGLILFVGYYFFFIKSNFKKILAILLVITIVPILLFKTGEDKIDKYLKFPITKFQVTNKFPITNNQSPITSSNVTESFDIRKIVWEGAWKLALKYPLFGTGVETFAYSYYLVRPVAHNLTSEWDFVYNKAHNEYFNYLATTGFVGLISYFVLIISFIIYVFLSVIPVKTGIQMTKQNNQIILSICLFIGWVTILITNFFGFSTTTIQLFFFLIPALVLYSNDFSEGPTRGSTPTSIVTLQKILIFILSAISIYFLFSISVYYLADVNYSYGLKYVKINDQQKAASYFEKALKLRQEPVYMDKFSSALAYLSALANAQNQKETANQILNLSETLNKKNLIDYPNNVFYWKTRAKNMYYFYLVTNKESELLQGIEALKSAQKLSLTDPKIPYSLALYYSILFDSSKNSLDKQNWKKLSLEEIDKTIKLKSNYQEAYLLKEQLLKKYGQLR